MRLSRERVEAHVNRYSRQLSAGGNDPKKNWPKFLFHHTSIPNAVSILNSGELLSRSRLESEGLVWNDCASPDVLCRRTDAREFARLYFRPRNPTQYWIEGIRSARGPFLNNDPLVHLPVPVFLLFDAIQVLTIDNIQFADGNAQRDDTEFGMGEEFFDQLNFEHVYHTGHFDPRSEVGQEIKRARCAEVLVPGRLALHGNLAAILCRSDAERLTLLDQLGSNASRWTDIVKVPVSSAYFEKRFSFIDSIQYSGNRLEFRLRSPVSSHVPLGERVGTEIICRKTDGTLICHHQVRLYQNSWHVEMDLGEEKAIHCEIKIEGHLAASTRLQVTSSVV